MFLLSLFTGIKKWLVIAIGAIVLFFSTYFAGILKGRLEVNKEVKVGQEREQAQAQKVAQDTYNQAEQAAQNVPPTATPNVDKRDDLDTTN
jgi:Sec-independent protein translocase protein TatA